MKYLIIILFLATIINICIAIYALVFRKNPLSFIFGIYTIAIGFYTFGYAFELSSTTLEEIKFWLKFEYLGISFLPTIWLILSLRYVGKENILRKRHYIAMFGFSLLTCVLHFTNDYHHLFYKEISIDASAPHTLVYLKKGIWYWVHQAYANFTTLTGNVMLLQMLLTVSKPYRKQTFVMLFASFVPWIFYITYITGNSPHNIDLIAVGLTISGVIYAVGLFRYNLFEFVPLALENVFEHMEAAVIIIDRNNLVANFNKYAANLFPILHTPEKSKNLKAILAEYSQIYNLALSEVNKVVDIEIESHNGSRFFHTSISAITGNNKKQIGKIIILTDITDKREALEIIVKNESRLKELVATKDKFFSIIAHDLMNPFNALIGYGQLLQDRMKEKQYEDASSYIEIMNNSSKQVYSLLQNLLIWSRAQTGNMKFNAETLNLKLLVEEVHSLMKSIADSKQIDIAMDVSENLKVAGDYNMLNAILRNLVSNAIKFTGHNGHINIKAYTENSAIVVCVVDSGIGITEEEQKNLFTIGQSISTKGTDNETGTGLGLIICKEFIELHKGKIWVESTPGKGSSFFFSIPTV